MRDQASADLLADWRARREQEPRLGCSLSAHRDLGYCSGCPPTPERHEAGERRLGAAYELAGWRLLAMAERGVPDQPRTIIHGPALPGSAPAASRDEGAAHEAGADLL